MLGSALTLVELPTLLVVSRYDLYEVPLCKFVLKQYQDVSKYPDLMQLLMARGATDDQIRGLAGENLIRVWGNIEQRAREIQAEGVKPIEDEWEGRTWHHAYKSSPYMMRKTRERAALEDWGEPNQFNVNKAGKHQAAVKEDKHI